MTLEQYERWLNSAAPGDMITYHVGELARDRGRYGPKMEWLPAEPLHSLAARIYADMERGLVTLTQVPEDQGYIIVIPGWGDPRPLPRQFSYRAQRTSKEL